MSSNKVGWAQRILETADYKCSLCGNPNNLVAHHILSVREYPKLEFEDDNGRCLCKSCHSLTHKRGEGNFVPPQWESEGEDLLTSQSLIGAYTLLLRWASFEGGWKVVGAGPFTAVCRKGNEELLIYRRTARSFTVIKKDRKKGTL